MPEFKAVTLIVPIVHLFFEGEKAMSTPATEMTDDDLKYMDEVIDQKLLRYGNTRLCG